MKGAASTATARISRMAPWAVACVLVIHMVVVLQPRITWYLGTGQFGVLTFARDLTQGRLLHRWPPAEALAARLPSPTDMLAQTYVWDDGRLYSRFAPGFPLFVAGAMAVFGETAAHYVNPSLVVVLVGLLVVLGGRLTAPWRGVAAAAVFLLFSERSFALLWSTTPTRDVLAHVMGLWASYLLARRSVSPISPARGLSAFGALGFAMSVRPDALLYLVPASFLTRPWRRRMPRATAAAAAVGLVIGLAPSFAFYAVATGCPLRPTQAMEVREFFAPPSAGRQDEGATPDRASEQLWHGGAATAVQGGGLKLAHLATTFPKLLQRLERTYGVVFIGVAVWGALVAWVCGSPLFVGTVPYVLAAMLVYGCWSRPVDRFLIGVDVLLPMLFVEGLWGNSALIERAATWRSRAGRLLAPPLVVTGVIAAVVVWQRPGGTPNVSVPVAAALLLASAAVAACAWKPRWSTETFVSACGAIVFVVAAMLNGRHAISAPFQRAHMEAARENVRRLVGGGAVIITTEDVGRPAENIEFYARIPALYLTDLSRWGLAVPEAAQMLLDAGLQPYLFLPEDAAAAREVVDGLSPCLAAETVASIPPADALSHFVASPYRRPTRMRLSRIRRVPSPSGVGACGQPRAAGSGGDPRVVVFDDCNEACAWAPRRFLGPRA